MQLSSQPTLPAVESGEYPLRNKKIHSRTIVLELTPDHYQDYDCMEEPQLQLFEAAVKHARSHHLHLQRLRAPNDESAARTGQEPGYQVD